MATEQSVSRFTIANQSEDAPDESQMEIVLIPDKGGNTIKYQIFEGKYYLTYFKPPILRGVKSADLREDDIYFVSYLRTGGHWTFEMIQMLLNGKAETITKFIAENHIETSTHEDFAAIPSPRVVGTHLQLSDAPAQLVEKKCKIVYKLRDPKDVAVSLFNLYRDLPYYEYRGEFKDFLYLFLEGKVDVNGIFDHLRDAERFFDAHPDIPVHIQAYEDAIKDPVLENKKLSEFLGLGGNDDLCKAIAEKCEFKKLKADKDAYTMKLDGKSILFRKGTSGDWKNWFTDEMLEDYYRVYEEKMAGSRFYERYAREK